MWLSCGKEDPAAVTTAVVIVMLLVVAVVLPAELFDAVLRVLWHGCNVVQHMNGTGAGIILVFVIVVVVAVAVVFGGFHVYGFRERR